MSLIRHRMTLVAALAAVLVVSQATAATSPAAAQCTGSACRNVTATAKGIVGGALIGAEIGLMIPALIVSAGARELDEWWAYILFPLVVGAGGAVGGYFALEDPGTTGSPNGFPEAAVAVMAVGMALIVPTFVGVLALTSYSPGPSDGGDGATGEEDAQEPPEVDDGGDQGETQSALRRTLAGGPGLLRLDRGQLLLGIPMVHTRDSFTAEEREHLQLGPMRDLNIPLVSGVF